MYVCFVYGAVIVPCPGIQTRFFCIDNQCAINKYKQLQIREHDYHTHRD